MSEEEINIAIAEYRGWQILEPEVHSAITYHWAIEPDSSKSILPDYCNDLNAIHEAILSLPFGLRDNTFILILANVCGFKAHGVESWSELHAGRFAVINATASQRAEAFLRTIGKWEESK